MENLGVIDRGTGFVELYRKGDQHVVVSTIDLGDIPVPWSAISNFASTILGKALSGEETMAFLCDEDGDNWNYSEVAGAKGEGSRERVLATLAEQDQWAERDIEDIIKEPYDA